ncbi:cupredoxin domain-containing protein [Sphingomonas nostoxanthinifaciens]|uniref:cupredoxin domain-containing protein n=1 Tax=Sphingomonas nostoxanthinifaciens TaxID=2872652 RepID=UPI001CC1CFA2|nr:cupredoxin domain-containing protein [Sphingomonas nostoxanthinifaciens]UAK23192.1 cupredoxin domain-containing protein [Sphingomonas nostoxanthinifaciens]
MKDAIAAFLLLTSSAAGAQQTDWSRAARVDVDLSSFRFRPAILHLKHGQAYTIVFHNSADGGHDFVAKDFFAHAMLAPAARRTVSDGEVELHGGESATISLIAPPSGTYEAHCSHFMHKTMGMTGEIIVE